MLKQGRFRVTASCGFTLLEIAVAISILGIGLATLVTLQTRYIAAYELESDRTFATLTAQYILTKLEQNPESLVAGTVGGALKSRLEQDGYYDYKSDLVKSEDHEHLDAWTYQLSIRPQDVPPNEDVLRRIDLTITWDGGDLSFVYFVRTPS